MIREYLNSRLIVLAGFAVCLLLMGCQPQPELRTEMVSQELPIENKAQIDFSLTKNQLKVLDGAKLQLNAPAIYDASYQQLEYPGGDVALNRGACTDVVIRALRHAGFDLQELIHEDSKIRNYPSISQRDKNIDHRRCPNIVYYFKKYGTEFQVLTNDLTSGKWEPGDFVFWKLDNGLDHVGVVSDHFGESGHLKLIHNISKVKEEDVMEQWKVVGHFRFPK